MRLSYVDFGGTGPVAVLLHGLYGRALEWASTVEWLRKTHRVFALDARGHGMSQQGLPHLSREALVSDTVAFITLSQKSPITVIGQSMGGVSAFLLAARRPDLVEKLVVIEAADRGASWVNQAWHKNWPLPFVSIGDAKRFFKSQGVNADVWVETLRKRAGGYVPEFRVEDMDALTSDIGQAYDFRALSASIECPTLVIGGGRSRLDQELLKEMATRIPRATYQCVDGAGHDVHLDNPTALSRVVQAFLAE